MKNKSFKGFYNKKKPFNKRLANLKLLFYKLSLLLIIITSNLIVNKNNNFNIKFSSLLPSLLLLLLKFYFTSIIPKLLERE